MSVIYATVPISVITELQDYLCNHGAQDLSTWKVEIRLYRANASSFGQDAKNKLLFTIWASHEPHNFYITPAGNTESEVLATPEFKQILDSKLQSLWQLRQTFKGEGRIFRCDDGGEIRISNILVQGNYKGLLVDADSTQQCAELVKLIKDEFNVAVNETTASGRARARLYQQVYK